MMLLLLLTVMLLSERFCQNFDGLRCQR